MHLRATSGGAWRAWPAGASTSPTASPTRPSPAPSASRRSAMLALARARAHTHTQARSGVISVASVTCARTHTQTDRLGPAPSVSRRSARHTHALAQKGPPTRMRTRTRTRTHTRARTHARTRQAGSLLARIALQQGVWSCFDGKQAHAHARTTARMRTHRHTRAHAHAPCSARCVHPRSRGRTRQGPQSGPDGPAGCWATKKLKSDSDRHDSDSHRSESDSYGDLKRRPQAAFFNTATAGC